jgi:GNAT superfamily N-acetyltransferase
MMVTGASVKLSESSGNDSGPCIRRIETRDAPEAAELIAQLGYQRSLHDVVAWIAALGNSLSTQACFVACIGNQVVGWIEVSLQSHMQSPPFALIGGLVVKDGVRGKGIGKRLCEEAEAWCREKSVDLLRVTSRSTRLDAHRFYTSNGFTPAKISHVFEKIPLKPGADKNTKGLKENSQAL